jgi:ATP/maltotriose-dependent transcriptional regulator MalT
MVNLGRWDESLPFSARSTEIAKRIGAEHRLAWSHMTRAFALYGKGDVAGAAAVARAALALTEATGELRVHAFLLGVLSCAEADIRDDNNADAHSRAALEIAEAQGIVAQAFSRQSRAYVHMQWEEWKQAADLIDQWEALLGETDNRLLRLWARHNAAEVVVRQGRTNEALSMIGNALAAAREVRSQHYEGVAQRVQGQILASLQRWDEAARAFDDAAALLEANGSRLELGRAWFHRALMRQARGDGDGARADLTRAGAIFERTGARREQERVERTLVTAPTEAGRSPAPGANAGA